MTNFQFAARIFDIFQNWSEQRLVERLKRDLSPYILRDIGLMDEETYSASLLK